MTSFKFNEKKAAEVLAYVAGEWDNITQFYAAKVIFFAEKKHVNQYARPIVADTFFAMRDGPVPTKIYDIFKSNFLGIKDKKIFTDTLSFSRTGWNLWGMKALREPDLTVLSKTDIECLDEAIKFCRGKSKETLSNLTHKDRSWKLVRRNDSMDYAMMVDDDNPHKEEILEEMEEFSQYGVL